LGAWRQGQRGSGSLEEVSVLVAAIHSALSHIFDFIGEIYTTGCYLICAPHANPSWRPRWRVEQ
jgi:hypothetical protein